MASQPSYRPMQASTFFADGRSARPLVPGTIARGSRFDSGLKVNELEDRPRPAALLGAVTMGPLAAASQTAGWSFFYKEEFPIPIAFKELERGQERFNIYCAVCHDRVGNGRGMIVERGFTAPPSFHTDLSRGFKLRDITLKLIDAPVGYYFEVITHGFGAMPDYADQVRPDDRWKIIAYIRALQFSQRARLDDIPLASRERKRLELEPQRPENP